MGQSLLAKSRGDPREVPFHRKDSMTFEELLEAVTALDYPSKLKLAQYLTEQVRNEEKTLSAVDTPGTNLIGVALTEEEIASYVEYIAARLLKSKPKKLKQLLNFIKAMFQFKGGISEHDVFNLISKLKNKNVILIEGNHVSYPGS
jgi:hypothetical protein